ncbi:unnamed protein product [Candidula unifasciata]|uniref:Serpin domain-containing protein n=1 Tax=Candidula unifasciata TaxID=100452 RepID=A0A8S3ZV87_9EUPU|nr:unnamed protein product [Candidula unifasciata]
MLAPPVIVSRTHVSSTRSDRSLCGCVFKSRLQTDRSSHSCVKIVRLTKLQTTTMNPALTSICLLVIAQLTRADDVQLLTSASSGFAQKLYNKLAAVKPASAIYSPFSIHSALSMTSLGARGETATELSTTLGLTALTGNSVHHAYHDLIKQLNNVTDVKLHTANAVFVNPNIAIEEQFIKDVKTEYLATSSNFDLAAVGGPEKAINDFVSEKTEGLIKDVLPQGSIDALTAMVLLNTIFFNGTWLEKFDQYNTKKSNFQKLGGAKSQVDMMYAERSVNIKRNVQGVDVAELPFKGGRFSLYIALPQETEGLATLENFLNSPSYLTELFEGLSRVRVRLSVPKFRIESTFELNSALKELGIRKAFDQSSANFQGISATGNVYISEVIHKAVIEVKETGTVAAAVTVIGIKTASIELPPEEEFNADHPFVFFLRDNQSEEILFQGKYLG